MEKQALPYTSHDMGEYGGNMKPVAFVGMGEGWRNAPFGNKQFELWTCNQLSMKLEDKEIDICFDMHDWEIADYYPKYYEHLQKKHAYKIIVPRKNDKIPKAEIFPLKAARRLFPDVPFGCTLSYVIAYATIKGVQDLYMWGLNTTEFLQYPEYGHSFYYCMGIARSMGTTVHMLTYDVPKAGRDYGYVKYSWKDSYLDIVTIVDNDNYVIKDKE